MYPLWEVGVNNLQTIRIDFRRKYSLIEAIRKSLQVIQLSPKEFGVASYIDWCWEFECELLSTKDWKTVCYKWATVINSKVAPAGLLSLGSYRISDWIE